ncbi:hypothetical protein KEM52_003854, partial [Ascosphaera acerosa]
PSKLVDRRNPRKILVSLAGATPGDADTGADGTTPTAQAPRPRPAAGTAGGRFAGFNDLLPAPKRAGQQRLGGVGGPAVAAARKPFSLKTAAEPSFARGQQGREGEYGAGVSSTTAVANLTDAPPPTLLPNEVKITGNAMMFKPLSVARNSAANKRRKVLRPGSGSGSSAVAAAAGQAAGASVATSAHAPASATAPAPAPPQSKPKVSLFGLRQEDTHASAPESLDEEEVVDLAAGAVLDESDPYAPPTSTIVSSADISPPPGTTTTINPPADTHESLASIANDLNLSASEKRQLFGRRGTRGDRAPPSSSIVHFNTDAEYAANAAYLASVSEQELAAQQNTTVRSIAPGKHSLQQLVNSVQSQREALEESFAAGRRNRKEAGSKYGW